tara:strand:+ start:319 stop:591 length:273 start_codon:yes stop_codon:yes gene_type:complete
MRNNLGNIDKQPDGSYVGYAVGHIWNVRRFVDEGTKHFKAPIPSGWEAYREKPRTTSNVIDTYRVRAKTLRELSQNLAWLDILEAEKSDR